MSNNSHPCRFGGEIGRAQVAQAEACGLEPGPVMNPILLKPTGAGRSQVVVNGRPWKTLTAREYYTAADDLRPHVMAANADLSRRFDVVIVEGAGTVSELNLLGDDLLNLGLATRLEMADWFARYVRNVDQPGLLAVERTSTRSAGSSRPATICHVGRSADLA